MGAFIGASRLQLRLDGVLHFQAVGRLFQFLSSLIKEGSGLMINWAEDFLASSPYKFA